MSYVTHSSKSKKSLPATTVTQGKMIDLQHFVELGRLSATILHEISGPLTAALLNLEQVEGPPSPHVRQARRNLGVLRNYVEAARQQLQHSDHLSSFCILPHIDQVKRLVGPLARQQDIQLTFNPIPHYQLYGDPIKFQQIMSNLIMNAVDAYSSAASDGLSKHIVVSATGRGQSLEIVVCDWGEGIPSESLPRLFEPFYTTKKGNNQHGLGIGLTIVRQYVRDDFHGDIRVTSSARLGTRFSLRLPALPYPHSHLRRKPYKTES